LAKAKQHWRAKAARDPVARALSEFLSANPDGRLRVGFSGGRDSAVLLTALAELEQARERDLRAIHIDHGLHPDSQQWAEHAVAMADKLALPISVTRVDLSGRSEVGTEARARQARREVYAQHMAAGDWVLLAHHREDQAETVLLRLLSGAGLNGLGAIRQVSPLGSAWVGRPLLSLPGSVIEEYAETRGVERLVDPANSDPQHERSWLRTQIMPQLALRHPEIAARLARTADWMQQSAGWMEQQAQLERAQRQGLDPATLDVRDWLSLPQPLRFEVLAGWLAELGLKRPGVVAFSQTESDLIAAREDANPQLRWSSGTLRRYRGHLAWVPMRASLAADYSVPWTLGESLPLPAELGQLNAVAALPSARPCALTVTVRRGGERFRQAPNRPNRTLQHWLQDLGVPPWERERLLLLWQADQLAAVLAADSGAVVLRNEAVDGWVFQMSKG